MTDERARPAPPAPPPRPPPISAAVSANAGVPKPVVDLPKQVASMDERKPSPPSAPTSTPTPTPILAVPSVRVIGQTQEPALGTRTCPICGEMFPGDFRVCPRDAVELEEAVAADEDPLIGQVFGDVYQIVRRIGEGGMGRVYEARHRRLQGRRFAIKVMHAFHARQAELVTRFRREARAASQINHPNVVGVYDVHDTDSGIPYIVCEYLEGEDLGWLIDRVQRLDAHTATRIVAQVCRALDAAHEHGIVHRDMKPENVYIVGELATCTVKLLDFGIAKVEDPNASTHTRTGLVMGTPAYMAPEQARGARVDLRADIYAVGAILYRCLTGHLPYEREDPTQTLSALLTEEPPRPRTVDPSISAALELVIQKAMAREPKDRYDSMAALEADLRAFYETHVEVIHGDSSSELIQTSEARATQILRSSREAEHARPWIGLGGGLAGLWLYAGIVEGVTSIVRLLRGSITSTEALLIALGTLATLATPAVLVVRKVASTTWTNSVRAVALSRDLRAAVGSGLSAYAAFSLLVALVGAVIGSETLAIAPLARLLVLSVSAAAGFAGFWAVRRVAGGN